MRVIPELRVMPGKRPAAKSPQPTQTRLVFQGQALLLHLVLLELQIQR